MQYRGAMIPPPGDRQLDGGAGGMERPMAQARAFDGDGRRRDERDPHARRHQTQDGLRMIGLVPHPERETHVTAESHHEIVVRRRPLTGDEDVRLVGKPCDGDALPGRQAVPLGEDDDEWLREDALDGEIPVVHGRTQEPDLNAILAERQDLIGRVELADLKVNVGMPLDERANDDRKDREVCPRHEAHPEAASRPTRRPPGRLRGPLGVEQDRSGLVEECASRVRQLDATLGPVEERDAELGFELSDLLTERRLGHAQTQCRPAEVQLLGDGHEISEVPKLHP